MTCVKDKCQLQADQATVGILNDSDVLLSLPVEYVNLEWLLQAKEKLESVITKASQGHMVVAYRSFEEVGEHVRF